ncbi:MAG: hypothetical protein KA746_12880 [Pyrinomonadaceae bacterium]|nr:hypothetical protein [Pyrinomonadaceae bacterium]
MKKLSMIFVLLLASIGFGQQHDRWNGLVIDETTPEQAIAKFGKPNADTKGEYANLWFARSLTNDIRKPIYRTLEFGEVGVSTSMTLTFSAGKLVAITAYPKDAPASEFVNKLGTSWRLPGKDAATDFEEWDKPRSSEPRKAVTDNTKGPWTMGYGLIVKTPKVFALISVIPGVEDMSRTSVSESGPFWGNVMNLEIVSRILERKPGEPEAGDGPIPAGTEAVMAPGSSITAETTTGTITITAGKGLLRSYTWEGATRSVEMRALEGRWKGSLGTEDPSWREHNGINRGMLDEGNVRFATVAAAMKWINEKSKELPIVYRNDGLLIGFGKNLSRGTINVGVWQIYINGKKPTKLAGSQDAKIR